jgi:hypothetical protein
MGSLSGTAEKTSHRTPSQGGGYREPSMRRNDNVPFPSCGGVRMPLRHITAERVGVCPEFRRRSFQKLKGASNGKTELVASK